MGHPSSNFILVLVTAGSETEAQAIARAMITEKLAACVNFYPVRSLYRWQGQMQEDQEWQLVIKTTQPHFSTLALRVQALHSYDVPEIIALPITEGTPAYLQWLADSIKL